MLFLLVFIGLFFICSWIAWQVCTGLFDLLFNENKNNYQPTRFKQVDKIVVKEKIIFINPHNGNKLTHIENVDFEDL